MFLPLLAITRNQVANYVDTLLWIYTILIFIRILMTWIPRIPYNPILMRAIRFLEDVTDPYLRLWRRIIPSFSGIDFSPIAAIFFLNIVGMIVVNAIAG